ncbi:MAG: 2-phosphosulfolactate phosphatase [Balneolaceae bacterium]
MPDLNHLDVFFSVQTFQEDQLRGKSVVIVDVLRATSTIVTALANGAKAVIPVGDMGEASRISQSVDSDDYLLCGEKDGIKIDGYDLGNSPLEYKSEVIAGKSLIFNTTNGTKAIKKSMGAEDIFIASFLNLDAVVDVLKKTERDIVIVCSGWRGRLSLEDLLLAGNIIYKLSGGTLQPDARDGAKVAFSLYEKFGNDLQSVILNSNHATRLQELGGNEDISYCCQLNSSRVLPVLKEGIITNRYAEETE